MRRENARRDRMALTDPSYSVMDDDPLSGLHDVTDRHNMRCRYVS
jgi:hypothetical protein